MIIAFFGALVISWGEVSSVPSPSFWHLPWHSSLEDPLLPIQVGEAKHKSRIIEAVDRSDFVVTFGKAHDACHHACSLRHLSLHSAGTYLCLCLLVWSLCKDCDLGLHDGSPVDQPALHVYLLLLVSFVYKRTCTVCILYQYPVSI